ncbi:MAG: winged helix-turn-helix transcriptional regulator [Myxococcales bacterium]|nr:winged helix-turn-helix transcriptional regulator [Myxococcales bacterium]
MVEQSAYEDRILRSLRRIIRAVDLHSRAIESQYGLTGPQLVCLRVIGTEGPLTPSALARHVDLSQATVTGIIGRLVKRQYVSRRRNARDRRRVTLSLLPAGRDLLREAPSPLQTRFAEQLAALPPENQLVISTMLEQIVRMMGAEDIEADPVLVAGSTDSVDVLGSVAVVGSPEPADPLLDDLEPDPSATH